MDYFLKILKKKKIKIPKNDGLIIHGGGWKKMTDKSINKERFNSKIFELTNISINETLSRTLITSITTLLALLSIFFFGGEILKGFSLAMIFGVLFGTYSSIYIANTVLVRLKVSQKTILKEDDKN